MNQVDFKEISNNKQTICCANCKWFDMRTCFCRLNPPTPLYILDRDKSYITSVFPKINMPELDWCQHCCTIE